MCRQHILINVVQVLKSKHITICVVQVLKSNLELKVYLQMAAVGQFLDLAAGPGWKAAVDPAHDHFVVGGEF